MLAVVAILLNCCLLAAFELVSEAYDVQTVLLVFVVVQLALFSSHLLVLRDRGRIDLLDGLNVLNLGFAMHFTVAPVLLISGTMQAVYGRLWDPSDIPHALVLVQLSCVAVQLGYYIGLPTPGDWVPFRGRVPSTGRVAVVAVALYLGALAVGPGATTSSWLPNSVVRSGLVVSFAALVFVLPYILVMLVPMHGQLGRVLGVGGGLVILLLTSVSTNTGSKAGAAAVILSVVMYRNYFVRPLRLRVALGVGAVVAMLVLYMNYLRFARAGEDLWLLSADMVNPFSEDNWSWFLQAGVASTITPFESFLVILNTFPEKIPFQHGFRMFQDMVLPLFPRVLFPEKPVVYGVAFFWEDLMGFLTLETPTYESVSLPGHLYVDFGIPGVVLCGVIAGGVQRSLYDLLVVRSRTRASVCLYAIVAATSMIASRALMWQTYWIITGLLVPAALIGALQKRRGMTPW